MFSRIIPILVLLFGSLTAIAQTPQSIQLTQPLKPADSMVEVACADQFAGTISFANFSGQSNDIDLDTIFFCFGDQIDITGNGDSDLTGDPNVLTEPGITYGFYDCIPSISGPDLTTILTDNCIIDDPVPANGIFITSGGAPNGDITFFNDGNLQTAFNGGDPLLIWYAPITVDDFGDKQYEDDGMGGAAGPCTNVNVDEAFAVVYLNEIEASNLNLMADQGGCLGTFTIEGGLPEFDNSNYIFTIESATSPGVMGEVINPGLITHGGTVEFFVPEGGIYSITIEDGKSCEQVFLADMTGCNTMELGVESATTAPSSNVCIEVTVGDGFVDISAITLSFNWDPNVLTFTNGQNYNPNVPGLDSPFTLTEGDPGELILNYFDAIEGHSLPAGVVLFELCFDAVGLPGDCSEVAFSEMPVATEILMETAVLPVEIGFSGTDGSICIDGATISLAFDQTPVTCPNDLDGSFTVDIAGGTAPYDLQWQAVTGGPLQGPVNVGGTTFTTPLNQAAGEYSVTVSDGTTSVVDTVEVLADPGFFITINEFPPICPGFQGMMEAGIVDLTDNTVVTDVSGFDFNWSNGSMTSSTGVINPGFYSVTVTDADGCTYTNSSQLAEIAPFDVDVNITSASCSGVDDGGILLNVSGATPDANNDYTIVFTTIGTGTTFTNNVANVSGLEPACYPIEITDDNGCQFFDTICVDALVELSVNAVVQDPFCNDTETGSIFVSGVTTGAPAATPYTFTWLGNPPPTAPTNTPTTSQLTNLGVAPTGTGTYNLTMTDQNGCEIDTTFTINEPEALDAILLASTPETCNVGNDGTATLGVTGGTYPYAYDWGPGIAMDSVVTNLTAGMYTVTVTDFNLCEDTVQVTINVPQPPVITALDDDVLNCPEGTNGSLEVVVADPGSVAAYNWTPNTVGPGATIDNLGAGEYIVTVVGNDGCETIDTALVIAPDPLVLDSVITMPTECPGSGFGQIAIFISGGTAPYFFDWPTELDIFDGAGTAVASGMIVTAGTYEITVTDANLCDPITVTAIVEDPPGIEIEFTAVDSVSCPGSPCDGTATATAMYADGTSGTFNFTWESNEADNGVTTSTASQLCAGNQTLTVSDGTCPVTDSVFVPSPEEIMSGLSSVENVSCTGFEDGSISVSAMGGTAPYTYLWSNNETGSMIDDLPPGMYIVAIEDANGCSESVMFEIEDADPFDVLVSEQSNVECSGEETGAVTIATNGGNTITNPTYTWTGGIGSANSPIAQNIAAGSYSVTATDSNGCQDSTSFTITENPPITFVIGEFEPINCFNESTFITVESAAGGSGTVYSFEVDNFGESPLGTLFPIFAGEHTITVSDEGINVSDGCFVDTTIFISEPAPISLTLPTEIEIELGDTTFQMNPIISATTQIDSFVWNPNDVLLCPDDTFNLVNCPNPLVNITTDQLFSLTIFDENGCEASAEILIKVDDNRNVFIPNIFSPNDDGRNDVFRIYTGLGVQNIPSFRVFNRWGSIVYEDFDVMPTPDGTVGWDGRFQGERLNADVYVYMIEVEFLDNRKLLYRGDITLIR